MCGSRLSASFGVTTLLRYDAGLETFLKRADVAMYEAKRSGRNRIAVADDSHPTALAG